MNSRLKRLHNLLNKNQVEGLLVSHQPNITYLTGFPSSDSYLLISGKGNFLITDSRYYQQLHRNLNKDFNVLMAGKSVFKTIAELGLKLKIKYLGFEAKNLIFAEYQQIKKYLRRIHFIPTYDLIEELRKIKELGELNKIKEAVNITCQALNYARKIIRPGLCELEIAAELERFIRCKGSRITSFETIVASGKNSGFPHHITSRRKLQSGESLFIDIGVDYGNYKSDLTRTLFLGKIPLVVCKIYNIVLKAQEQAIERIRPGVKISEIDRTARQYIEKQGYGGFFGHNLGHGLGLEVHESPQICLANKKVLQKGMVFTIEPAIYLPYKFGVRIEDDIAITEKGCEVLSGALNK